MFLYITIGTLKFLYIDISKIICIGLFIIIGTMLVIHIIASIDRAIILRRINKIPEEYGIYPGNILHVLCEEGYPETFEVKIKEVNKDEHTVTYIDEDHCIRSGIKDDIQCSTIKEFSKLYIFGDATLLNRYDFPEGQD